MNNKYVVTAAIVVGSLFIGYVVVGLILFGVSLWLFRPVFRALMAPFVFVDRVARGRE